MLAKVGWQLFSVACLVAAAVIAFRLRRRKVVYITDFQTGLRFRDGTVCKVLPPGSYLTSGSRNMIAVVDMRPRPFVLERLMYQDVLQTNSVISVGGELWIRDPNLAVITLKDIVGNSLPIVRERLCQAASRSIIDASPEGRKELAGRLLAELNRELETRGVEIRNLEITSHGRNQPNMAAEANYGERMVDSLTIVLICIGIIGLNLFRSKVGFPSSHATLPFQSGILFRQGRPVRELGPGRHRVFVGSEKIFFVDTRPIQVNAENRVVALADGTTAVYGISASAEVRSVKKAIYSSANYTQVPAFVTLCVARRVLNQCRKGQAQLGQAALTEEITAACRSRLAEAGFELLSFRFTQLVIAPSTAQDNRRPRPIPDAAPSRDGWETKNPESQSV
jgi:hypothetical protein